MEHSLASDSQCGVSEKLGLDLVYLAFRVEVLGDAIKRHPGFGKRAWI